MIASVEAEYFPTHCVTETWFGILRYSTLFVHSYEKKKQGGCLKGSQILSGSSTKSKYGANLVGILNSSRVCFSSHPLISLHDKSTEHNELLIYSYVAPLPKLQQHYSTLPSPPKDHFTHKAEGPWPWLWEPTFLPEDKNMEIRKYGSVFRILSW